MTAPFEIFGGAILGLAGLQVAVSLASGLRRYVTLGSQAEEQRQQFRRLADVELQAAITERDRVDLAWGGPRKFVIAERVYENPNKDVCSFYLKPHDRKELPPFHPGQFLTFQLHIPGQAKVVNRCYSLSDSPGQRDYYRVSIKRLGPPPNAPEGTPAGLSSSFFHDRLFEGDIVDVLMPAGEFYLNPDSERPVVLIGGGVGLTPVVSMLNHIVRSGSQREVWFFYGVRNRGEHAMQDHLAQIAAENANVHLVICYSEPSETCVEGRDYTHKGWVSVDLMKELLPANNYEFYICGPPPMMQAITANLEDWGVPSEDINFEAFGPASVKKTAPKPEEGAPAGESCEVVFARSDKTATWSEGSGSLLEFGEANGVPLDSGCRAGSCGTCLVAIKEGDVEYVQRPSRKPETGSCLVCISKPAGRLVLDV